MTVLRLAVSLLAALPVFGPLAAAADPCADLAGKVAIATKAQIGERIEDFVRFKAAPNMTLSLSCGGIYPSSVGAQFLGEAPPEAFFGIFGEAGEAVTAAAAGPLAEAAHKAQADSQTQRHSKVQVGGVMVTCSFTKSDKGALTMCAAIAKDDRS